MLRRNKILQAIRKVMMEENILKYDSKTLVDYIKTQSLKEYLFKTVAVVLRSDIYIQRTLIYEVLI